MRALVAVVGLLVAACGGAVPAVESGAPSTSPATSAPAAAPANALVATITNEGSKATVRVREQLAANNGPSDAVLNGMHLVSGAVALLPDGTFWPGASVKIELRRLQSDVPLRDKWLELFGPQFGRFPTATFAPKEARGLPTPLPSAGEWTFSLAGDLTIREVTRPVALAATLKRTGQSLSATARTTITWAQFDIPKPLNIPQVASVTDDIDIDVSFAATSGP
ncbi:MAG TPA: YceI family protein [Candidatus Limnocylindrales bacterium]|nr:YceI family protein [Candidatus Limnocylindrales bacterium]